MSGQAEFDGPALDVGPEPVSFVEVTFGGDVGQGHRDDCGVQAQELARQPAPLPPGAVLRAVTADADLQFIAAMESRIWGEDWSWLAAELKAGARSGAIAVLAAEGGGEIVSAAWLELKPGTQFAVLWGGARYLQVDASDASRPILERLGFTVITTTTPYVWAPPA